ncbi:unnamed protein product [Bursaphelenchus okinawaensis]|uniref:t-SNARE coiled-coil homology domain-containing protein n=1 Tax=Bursaphelenchus okinawaensis TaxID=465554 RepID=A0A811L9Y8_9BILA|nr:unnamed protein product [Bursaphelenchus okinawaensis]CAG9121811.1 unnamed protein product [Bursaphelenchus okinawaensis]
MNFANQPGIVRRKHPQQPDLPQYQQPVEEPKVHGNLPIASQFTQFTQNFWNTAHSHIQSLTTEPGHLHLPPAQLEEVEVIPLECVEIMPHTDRTAEFRTVAKSRQMRIQAQNKKSGDRDRLIQNQIQFNQLSKRIGRDLCRTCAKMEKLTELAKKKSLFDDSAAEINELSHIIKQDIHGLNGQIATLQQLMKSRQQSAEQSQNHSKLVVVGLQSKLANLGNNFQSVQEIRTESLKQKSKRREKFSQSNNVSYGLPPNGGSSLLMEDEQRAQGGTVAVDMDRIQAQDQMLLIDESEQYHQSRYNAMESIESSITEIGQIFNQLSMLVAEQGETIIRIDDNVEQATMNVESAHLELLKYFNNISKNRWLMLKVFGVLMAFFVFFVVFLT